MLLSARKESGKYTEGVVLTDNLAALFRNVPPALALALAQTEKDRRLRAPRSCAASTAARVEAAMHIAAEIEMATGGWLRCAAPPSVALFVANAAFAEPRVEVFTDHGHPIAPAEGFTDGDRISSTVSALAQDQLSEGLPSDPQRPPGSKAMNA